MMKEGENKINLSPILALNKKLTEGPKYMTKKSLTPEHYKSNEDYEGYGLDNRGNINTLTSLNDSRAKVNYNSTSNLRGSNCFKTLI